MYAHKSHQSFIYVMWKYQHSVRGGKYFNMNNIWYSAFYQLNLSQVNPP